MLNRTHFGGSSGDYLEDLNWVCRSIEKVPAQGLGYARQSDAATRSYSRVLVSTDPPYYDNIGYSDLADFFYVWLRRSLRSVHPELFCFNTRSKGGGTCSKSVSTWWTRRCRKILRGGFLLVESLAQASRQPDDLPVAIFTCSSKQSWSRKESPVLVGQPSSRA